MSPLPMPLGHLAMSGAAPQYISSCSVSRDASDAKNILYIVNAGVWLPGDAYTASATYNYEFIKWNDGVTQQNGSSNSLNVGGDPQSPVQYYYCKITVTNDNASTLYQTGLWSSNYPSANPNVYP